MKIRLSHFNNSRKRDGFSVLTIMALLGIMTIFIAVNNVTLRSLNRELSLLDKKQTLHWRHVLPNATASVKITTSESISPALPASLPND